MKKQLRQKGVISLFLPIHVQKNNRALLDDAEYADNKINVLKTKKSFQIIKILQTPNRYGNQPHVMTMNQILAFLNSIKKAVKRNAPRPLYNNHAKKLIPTGNLNPRNSVMNKNTANKAQNIPVGLFFF